MAKLSFLTSLEKAVLPVTLVITAKLISIFLISNFLGEIWSFGVGSNLTWGVLQFSDHYNFYLINSFSDLFAAWVCAIGFSWTLFRHVHFNHDTIHPAVASRVHQKNQKFLLISTAETFSQGSVWLTLSWVVFALTLSNVLNNVSDPFVAGLSFATSFGLSYGLYLEFKKLLKR